MREGPGRASHVERFRSTAICSVESHLRFQCGFVSGHRLALRLSPRLLVLSRPHARLRLQASDRVANDLPGPGSVYLGQTLKFILPVFLGDTVTATVEVLSVRSDKPIVTLSTVCTNQNDEVVLEGEAVVKFSGA